MFAGVFASYSISLWTSAAHLPCVPGAYVTVYLLMIFSSAQTAYKSLSPSMVKELPNGTKAGLCSIASNFALTLITPELSIKS